MVKLGESMENLKINFKGFYLDNGFKIIFVKKKCNFFNLSFGVKVGSAYECDTERGFSHFVEHMLFRSNFKFSDTQVNKIIEFLGGDFNAFTDYGSTNFSVNGLSDDIEKAVELLSNMVMKPKFDSKEIDIEREIILSEIDSCNSNYEDYSFIKLNQEAFEKSHLKYDVAGTKEIIKSLTNQDLIDFHKKYYVPSNCYMVVIGYYDENYIVSLLKKYFNSWQNKAVLHNDFIIESNIPKFIVTDKSDLELSTITYLFTFKELRQHEKIFLKIAEYKLGGSSNSILFKKIREEEGLAYDVYTQLELSDEFKGMYIFCATNVNNIDKVKNIIEDCIEDIKKFRSHFDEYNLQLMKKLQLISIYSTLDDNEKLGMYILDKMISNREIDTYLKDLLMIENISADELTNVCRKYFNNPTIHILRRK